MEDDIDEIYDQEMGGERSEIDSSTNNRPIALTQAEEYARVHPLPSARQISKQAKTNDEGNLAPPTFKFQTFPRNFTNKQKQEHVYKMLISFKEEDKLLPDILSLMNG